MKLSLAELRGHGNYIISYGKIRQNLLAFSGKAPPGADPRHRSVNVPKARSSAKGYFGLPFQYSA